MGSAGLMKELASAQKKITKAHPLVKFADEFFTSQHMTLVFAPSEVTASSFTDDLIPGHWAFLSDPLNSEEDEFLIYRAKVDGNFYVLMPSDEDLPTAALAVDAKVLQEITDIRDEYVSEHGDLPGLAPPPAEAFSYSPEIEALAKQSFAIFDVMSPPCLQATFYEDGITIFLWVYYAITDGRIYVASPEACADDAPP